MTRLGLSHSGVALHLSDQYHDHPLALPTVISTFSVVLHQGATLVQESGPVRRALSLGTGYRSLTNESGQGRRPAIARRGTEICAISKAIRRVRVSWRVDMTRASQLLARIGIAAAAVTVPLVLAAPAVAGPALLDTWDRVAQCESGGNWSANTGNGYFGGLQFSRGTWHSYGGGAYASSANRATRSQQIAVAQKVLRTQGWRAWPACSRKIGVR
jgi:transglycosylase-like protein